MISNFYIIIQHFFLLSNVFVYFEYHYIKTCKLSNIKLMQKLCTIEIWGSIDGEVVSQCCRKQECKSFWMLFLFQWISLFWLCFKWLFHSLCCYNDFGYQFISDFWSFCFSFQRFKTLIWHKYVNNILLLSFMYYVTVITKTSISNKNKRY